MQYWIFYTGGVGGDGFCNLLEHAENVKPADGLLKWRIHTKQDRGGVDLKNTVKFYGPNWSVSADAHPFRKYNCIVPVEQIKRSYIDIVANNLNTVIPCHTDVYFQQINDSKYKNIVEQNQVKIHLYSFNFNRVNEDLILKTGMMPLARGDSNLNKKYIGDEITKYYDSGLFDYELDIEQVWRKWDYLKDFLDKIGLVLDQKYYNEYINLVNPDRNVVQPT
jgi:hypothetical protein